MTVHSLLCLAATTSAFGSAKQLKSQKIVYGVDNRVDTYDATRSQKRLALSTAGMIKNQKLVSAGDHFILPPATIQKEMNLCSDQRFKHQPSAVICSGFLVGPDLLVTAGHCIPNQESCDGVSWVFDYKENESTQKTDVMVPKSKVFKCSKVLEAKLEGYGASKHDYALVKLERVASGRKALKYRKSGKLSDSEAITVIGHPSGLPQKVTSGAQVVDNSAISYFETNLDTFGGNSGSAVFNDKTGQVEGILVRGATDYVRSANGCIEVNQVDATPEQVAESSRLGESVSRITDIKTLKYRRSFLKAAKTGDLEAVKKLANEVAYIDIYDNRKFTPLHLAAKYGHIDVVEFLVDKGADINAQNINLETPLHLAAFKNQRSSIIKLINLGADVLIKDHFGVYASKRTNYFAFKLRNFLKKVEREEVLKRKKK